MDLYELDGEIVNKLREYTEFENDEYSEACRALCDLASYPDYLSEKASEIIAMEIVNNLNNYKNNTVIKTESKTYTTQETYLEWV